MTDTLTPLKFVMVEFKGNFDSNAMKKRWVEEFHYEDITPPLPGVGTVSVPTFGNKPVIAKWAEFQDAILTVDPDILYVSGHHGRQYEADWDGRPSTWQSHIKTQKETGFFNDLYYKRTWYKHYNEPNADYEIYMTTSNPLAPPPPGPPPPPEANDNPFFKRVNNTCRCVLLIGCHSQSYTFSQQAWRTFFPNALIVGMLARINGGEKWIRPFLRNEMGADLAYNSELRPKFTVL